MFIEAAFREILLPSTGNVNDFVAHIERKYVNLYGNRTSGPG